MKFARVALLLALTAAPSLAVVKNQPPGSGGGGGGSGTVTQVSATAVAPLCVSGSPITISGTLTFTWCTGALGSQYGGTGEQGTITGLLRGNGTSPFTAAGYSDVVGLFSGTPSSTCYLSGSGACSVPPGGAIPSTTDVLIGNGSGGAADSGIGLIYLPAYTSMYFGTGGLATSSTGVDNLTIGYGAGSNLTNNSGGEPGNVLIGRNAGNQMTTAALSVVIGDHAFENYTGSAGGAEDGLVVVVGAYAGQELVPTTGVGVASVLIGQRAGQEATAMQNSVMIGAHDGVLATSSLNDVMIGAGTLNGNNGASVTSSYNVFVGEDVAGGNPTGTITENTAVGYQAGGAITGGAAANAFLGYAAGSACTTCVANVAIGYLAGQNIGAGSDNVFVGGQSGQYVSSSLNTLVGFGTGNNLSTGTATAVGAGACNGVSTGSNNTCIGLYAGAGVSGTIQNDTIIGGGAAQHLQGSYTTVIGYQALPQSGTTGNYNTEIGDDAAFNTTTGGNNTDLGYSAGSARTTGSNNTAIGVNVASTTCATGSNNIMFGTSAAVDCLTSSTSNEINIGGLLFYNNASTAAPTVSACGTSSIDSHANDKSGTVTTGTATSCTITFASAYTTWDHCRVTSQSALTAFAYSYTLSAITVTATALAGGKIDYDCDGV